MRSNACASEMVLRQKHNLERRARALDRGARNREQCIATAQGLQLRPGRTHAIEAVVAADAVAAQTFFETRDCVPVDLDARRRNQRVVSQPLSALRHHRIFIRIEIPHRVLYPAHAWGDEFMHQTLAAFTRINTAADKGP